MTAKESINRLIEGNRRFTSGKPAVKELGEKRIRELAENGQHPFAIIIGCSDSRVPPEIIFDQGLGDLFVIRTGGNIVDDIALGTIEYGAKYLQIPLIIVLGHENCGTVMVTVDGGEIQGCIKSLADIIKKSLDIIDRKQNVYEACEDENIRNTVGEIKKNQIIANLMKEGKVEVLGAKYAISSGRVTFF